MSEGRDMFLSYCVVNDEFIQQLNNLILISCMEIVQISAFIFPYFVGQPILIASSLLLRIRISDFIDDICNYLLLQLKILDGIFIVLVFTIDKRSIYFG